MSLIGVDVTMAANVLALDVVVEVVAVVLVVAAVLVAYG